MIEMFTFHIVNIIINEKMKLRKKIKYDLGVSVSMKAGDKANRANIGEEMRAILYSCFLYMNSKLPQNVC